MFSGEEESWSHHIVHPEMLPKSLCFDEQIDCKKVERGSTIVCINDCQLSGENFLSTSGYVGSISSQLFEAETDGWDLKIGWSKDWEIVESERNFPAIKEWIRIAMNMPLNWIVPSISTNRKGQIQKGSDGEVVRASAFHFNDPGFISRLGNRNFSSIFHQFCNFGTIRTLIW
jgi:hypothetical protein